MPEKPRHPVSHWLVPKRLDFDTMKELVKVVGSKKYLGKEYSVSLQASLGREFPHKGRGQGGLSAASIRHLIDSLRFFGFAYIDDNDRIRTTKAGEKFLQGEDELELFQRQLIKWQFPNPGQVNVANVEIRPFNAILKLLLELGYLTRTEIYMYLYDIKSQYDVDKTISNLRNFRMKRVRKTKDVRKLDRYTLYLTRILTRTGWFSTDGRSIFLVDERKEDAKAILRDQGLKPTPFDSIEAFYEYYGDPSVPELPEEHISELRDKLETLIKDNKTLRQRLIALELPGDEEIDKVIDTYKNIGKTWDPALFFEWNTKLAFDNIGGFHEVIWNGGIDEAGNPSHLAGGGEADIIVRSANFTLVVEVTLRTGVDQWNYEHRSVIDHVEEVCRKEKSTDRDVFGLFVAEKLHPRTITTFWGNVKDHGSVCIVPLDKATFVDILHFHKEIKGLAPSDFRSLVKLFERGISDTRTSSEWNNMFSRLIDDWKRQVRDEKIIFERMIYLHKTIRDYAREMGNLNVELTDGIIRGLCKKSVLFKEERDLRETLEIMSRFRLLKKNGNYTWSPMDDFEINISRLRKALLI